MADDKATTLALTLAREDVERIITDTIQAQIAIAIQGTGDDIITKLIVDTLQTKVPRDKWTQAQSTDPTMLEAALRKAITERVKGALETWLNNNAELMERNIQAALTKQSKPLAQGLVAVLHQLIDPTSYRNALDVHINLHRKAD